MCVKNFDPTELRRLWNVWGNGNAPDELRFGQWIITEFPELHPNQQIFYEEDPSKAFSMLMNIAISNTS